MGLSIRLLGIWLVVLIFGLLGFPVGVEILLLGFFDSLFIQFVQGTELFLCVLLFSPCVLLCACCDLLIDTISEYSEELELFGRGLPLAPRVLRLLPLPLRVVTQAKAHVFVVVFPQSLYVVGHFLLQR